MDYYGWIKKICIFFLFNAFVKTFIKDTWKFRVFLNNFAIPSKKIALILELLMYFFKVLP